MVVLWIAAIILSIYDIFAGISLLGIFRDFFFYIFIISTLKGVSSLVGTPLSGALMGMLDLIVGITSLLLLFGRDVGFFWIVGTLVLFKGIYCLSLLGGGRG